MNIDIIKLIGIKTILIIIQNTLITIIIFTLSLIFFIWKELKQSQKKQFQNKSNELLEKMNVTHKEIINLYKEMEIINDKCEQSQTSLYNQKKFLLDLIDILPIFLIFKTNDGIYKLINANVANLFNTTPSQLSNRKLINFIRNNKNSFLKENEINTNNYTIERTTILDINGNILNIIKFKYPFKDGILIFGINENILNS